MYVTGFEKLNTVSFRNYYSPSFKGMVSLLLWDNWSTSRLQCRFSCASRCRNTPTFPSACVKKNQNIDRTLWWSMPVEFRCPHLFIMFSYVSQGYFSDVMTVGEVNVFRSGCFAWLVTSSPAQLTWLYCGLCGVPRLCYSLGLNYLLWGPRPFCTTELKACSWLQKWYHEIVNLASQSLRSGSQVGERFRLGRGFTDGWSTKYRLLILGWGVSRKTGNPTPGSCIVFPL